MDIKIRKGTRVDMGAFVRFLYEVHAGMEHKEWFYLDAPEEFYSLMDSGAMELWLAEDGSRIAGAFDLLIPGTKDYNYGYCLGFTESELMGSVNMDSAAVHQDYRGMGLQRKLLQTAEAWLAERGDWILLCTVHPDNRYSLNNAILQGYEICEELPMYGSTRFLLKKFLKK